MEIKDLSVKFNEVVFENLNYSFPSQGVFCIMASSGKGKTTFLNAIGGLVKYSGTINKTGKIGYLFQNDRLLPWYSAKKNIELVSNDKKKTDYYINAFGINEYAEKLINQLSGGMKRRCALARCFSFDADIYLLDEPFRGLDEDNKQKVIDEIIKISKDKLFIIVTHDREDAEKLNGKIVNLFL